MNVKVEQKEQLYEGKAKKVYATSDPDLLIVDYKDDATAFNGLKKGTIVGKGVINNRMSNYLMQMLEKQGIETHYVEELSDRRTLVKNVKIARGHHAQYRRGFAVQAHGTARGQRAEQTRIGDIL